MGLCSSIPVNENIMDEIREIEHIRSTNPEHYNINLSELKFPQVEE